MKPRRSRRAVVVAAGLLAVFSATKTAGATREDGDSWRRSYRHAPCTISAGNGDKITGRLIPDPSCGMRRGAGPFPPLRDECFECVPVNDDFGAGGFFGMERAGREQPILMVPEGLEGELREPLVEQAVLEGPLQMMQELVDGTEAAWTGPGIGSDFDNDLALAAYATRASVKVSREGEDGGEQDGLVDAAGDIAVGILAALAAAAAAVVASVASDVLTEASGVFLPSSEAASEDSLMTSGERLDPPPGERLGDPCQQTVQDATRLRGAGVKVHGEDWPGSVAGVEGEAADLGMSFRDRSVAKIARRKLQEDTPAPTPATALTPAPAEAETPAPEASETPVPTTVETPAPAPVEVETPSPTAGVASDTPAPSEEESTLSPAPTEEESTLSPAPTEESTVSPALTESTVSPAPTEESTQSPASTEESTPSPAATEESIPSPAPTEESTLSPAPTEESTLSPALTESTVSPAPLDGATTSPAPTTGTTLAPGELTPTPTPASAFTLVPDESLAPATTLAPGITLTPAPTQSSSLLESAAPSTTLAPLGDGETQTPANPLSTNYTLSPLAPGETYAPSVTAAPSATPVPDGLNLTSSPTVLASPTPSPTAAPSLAATPSPTPVATPSPIGNTTLTEETLETTGEVASSAVTVGVAVTAAAATVTAVTTTATVTATTASTAAATTSTVTSTVTTAATTAATSSSGAGTSSTGVSAAGGASGGAGTGTTTTAANTGAQASTSASTGGGTQEALRTGAQNNVQSNTTTSNTTTLATDRSSISSRSPSASLGLLMIFQMQFVSLLRLLEANITDPFMNFLDSLKWLNLHFDVDFNFFNCDDEDVQFTWSNDDNGTWALNTFMVFGCLILLIIVHILVLSFLEASWLAQANAIHRHRLELLTQHNAQQEAAAPIDDTSMAAYERYLDAQNQDRELYEQEKLSTERYLRRHNSSWLYFPHMELLFLLFAYQGAASAEARLIYSGCFPLVVMGIFALVIFPVLMLIYVNRIVSNRLRPSSSPLVFKPKPNVERGCWLCTPFCCVCKAWKDGESMFAWADKGDWVSKNDEDVDLDSRKFRIGFEPLFVDYTQRGTLYLSFVLLEWLVFGLVCGLVTDGTIQTGIVLVVYVVDLLLLICLRPFSNSVIQCITTMTVFADALTVALMCYASLLDEDDDDDSERLDYIYAGALIIQTVTIIFFVVPLYMDSFVTITSLLCTKLMGICKRKEKPAKPPIKGSCGETGWIFCALVRENFMSCVKSTWRGPSYKPDSPAELQRRRSTLLQPISENASEDGITYSYRGLMAQQGRLSANNLPAARHPHSMSGRLALQDISDAGSNSSSHQRRGSTASSGGASGVSEPRPYERTQSSDRR